MLSLDVTFRDHHLGTQSVGTIRSFETIHLNCCALPFLNLRNQDRLHLRRCETKPFDLRCSIIEVVLFYRPFIELERRGFSVVDRRNERPDNLGLIGTSLFHGNAQVGPQADFHVLSGVLRHIPRPSYRQNTYIVPYNSN